MKDENSEITANKIMDILKSEKRTINEANRILRLVYNKLCDIKVS